MQVRQLEVGLDEARSWGEFYDAGSVGEGQHPAVGVVDDLLETRDQPGRQERPQVDRVERLPVGEPQPEAGMRVGGAPGPAPTLAQLTGCAAEDLVHGVVELPDTSEPRCERDVGKR